MFNYRLLAWQIINQIDIWDILSTLTFCQIHQLNIIILKIYAPSWDHAYHDLLLFKD